MASMDEQSTKERPQPPYPEAVGHPLTHSIRSMPDVLAFRDRALAGHDIARTYFFGPGDVYNLTHPSHVRRVLIDDRDTFSKSEDFHIAFDDGLVAVEGEQWQQQRRILQPLFSRDSVRSYGDGICEQIRRRTGSWSHGDLIDLQAEMKRLTLEVLFATLFGRELELNGDSELRSAAGQLKEWFAPTSYPLPTWIPTPARWRFKRGRRRLRTAADELLAEAAGGPSPDEAEDLLSLLVGIRQRRGDDGDVLADEQLRDQVVTLIFAGHETTAATLALALFEIARRPVVRAEFHREIDRLDGPPTPADVPDLEVTERLIRETLRLYPPVYILPRESAREVTVDGYRIPADVPVWLGIRQIHRDGRFYDAPKRFRPERWRDGSDDRPDFAYAPFGGGPRLCIGRQFALLEAKLALATIGRRFTLSRAGEDTGERANTSIDDSPIEHTTEPPLSADMTLRLASGTDFYLRER